MTNKPEDPHLPKPDDKKRPMPPSTDAIEGLEGAVSAAREAKKKLPSEPPLSDDAIDLSSPGEGADLSGISVIEWASLAEAPPPSGNQPADAIPEAKFDSPSDSDLISKRADGKEDASAIPSRTTRSPA